MQAARLLGAGPILAIDHHPRRLHLAARFGAHTFNYETSDVADELAALTGGIGPDAVIDAVGMEIDGFGNFAILDKAKRRVGLGADAPSALRDAIMACRKGGRDCVPSVYGGFAYIFPLGAVIEKGFEIKTGQTHVQKFTLDLLRRTDAGEIDTAFLISHRLPLEQAAEGCKNFAPSRTNGRRSF